MKKSAISVISFAVVGYLVICTLSYLFQKDLIYHPRSLDESKPYLQRFITNEIEIIREEYILHGWLINPGKSKLIIYYGGNGEEVSYNLSSFTRFSNYSSLFINYPGYGKSEGSPSQQDIFADALFIYDKFSNEYNEIVLFGRSLGSGVASYVAGKRNPEKIILVTPFDCLCNVASENFPFLPVDLMLTERYDSIENIGEFQNNSLVFIAGNDRVIPNELSYNLAEYLGQNAETVFIEKAGHNNIQRFHEYWTEIEVFLAE